MIMWMAYKKLFRIMNTKCIGWFIIIALLLYLLLLRSQHVAYKMQQIKDNVTIATLSIVTEPNPLSSRPCENTFQVVDVQVNGHTSFIGKKINNGLYVPFEFLHKYYEIGGEFVTKKPSVHNEQLHFIWSHTDNVFDPYKLNLIPYTTSGEYLNFVETDVANRGRVKCISGVYEVPITTQWDVKGYFYPIQIAQYGLSHISKFYNEKPVDAEKIINLSDEASSTKIPLDEQKYFIVRITMKQMTAFSLQVNADNNKKYTLRYSPDDRLVTRKQKTIVYGLGKHLNKNMIVRDLNVDLIKGLSFIDGKKEGQSVDIRIVKISTIAFKHIEYVKKVSLVLTDHVSKFIAAADWLVRFQDGIGGWKNNVSRAIIKEIPKLHPGWYSAMAQGQAISLLCRVYTYTKKLKYLNAAVKATKVFHIPSEKNGVLAYVFGIYPWYEEYPTTPSLFVLNGFIYSLLGLYDLFKTAESEEADNLFKKGFESLEELLPFYDNGRGSFYDLRHFSVPGHPPNIARWQYHRVHIELLHAIVQITGSRSINMTLHRWIGYAAGVPARHN